MRHTETKKVQPDLHLCKHPSESISKSRCTHSRAERGWQWCVGSPGVASSPSGEDAVLQAGGLAAPPAPLVTAGTALVERGARRWERGDEQAAERCCNNKRNKNLSRKKRIRNVTPATKPSLLRDTDVASQAPSLLLIYVSNIKITSS